jgi:NAD(P)-dependent dehydrogenase (short-subunit alcohol dehydrogenase family)
LLDANWWQSDQNRGMSPGSLAGRCVLVTGVSRRRGIGFAIARRLLADGATVMVQSWSPHDHEQPWGADDGGVESVIDALGGLSQNLGHVEADLAAADAPRRLVDDAIAQVGALDILIVNHARSSAGGLETTDADDLDRAWAVNARAAVLLVKAFAERHDDARGLGSVVLFTSGQHLAPMADELAYAISKGAVHQMTLSLADALAERQITVNAINPGPVDTGWATPDQLRDLTPSFPHCRWGTPDDIASIVRWLIDPDTAWMTGQIINAEGGFRRTDH